MFRNQIEDSVERDKYSINQLERILSNKNILKFLKINKNSKQIHNYIENNLKKEVEIPLKKDARNNGLAIDKIVEQKNNIDQKESGQAIESLDEDEELSFLADFFNPDLSEVLGFGRFQKKLRKTREVPDFKENNHI